MENTKDFSFAVATSLRECGYLSTRMLITLSEVCKTFNKVLYEKICNDAQFDYGAMVPVRYSHYNPRNVRIVCFNKGNSIQNLPQQITKLTFTNSYNRDIDFSKFGPTLHNSITQIVFGRNFNSAVLFLPPNLTHLTFGAAFNTEIENLPPKLTHLIFGYNFSKQLPTNKPTTLTHLKLGENFTQNLHFSEFPNLTFLHMANYSQSQNFCSLPNLTYFFINHSSNSNAIVFPATLQQLTFGSRVGHFFNNPNSTTHNWYPNLTHLNLGKDFNQSLETANLPTTITHLEFGSHFNQPVNNLLPPNLTHLIFGSKFYQPVDKLPQKLKFLQFGICFNSDIDGVLPPFLTHLKLGLYFNRQTNNLPKTLQFLQFDSFWNFPVNFLPPLLHTLILGKNFNQKIDNLPDSISHLTIGAKFDQEVKRFPRYLTSLEFEGKPYQNFSLILTLVKNHPFIKNLSFGVCLLREEEKELLTIKQRLSSLKYI